MDKGSLCLSSDNGTFILLRRLSIISESSAVGFVLFPV